MAFGDYATLLDNFNRADQGPPPSTDWTTLLNGHNILSNLVRGNNGSASNVSLWDIATYGADVEAYLSIPTLVADGENVEVYARMTTLVGATVDGYLARWNRVSGASNDTLQLYSVTNGVATKLGADIATQEMTAGDKLGIEIIGTTISLYTYTGGAWTNKGSRTDSTYSAAGYVGIGCVGNTGRFDDFYAGTITVASATSILFDDRAYRLQSLLTR